MDKVKVKREDLLVRIRGNRDKHRTIFEKALEGYRKEAVAWLEEVLDDAKGRGQTRGEMELIEPQDHTRDYDRVILMLEMSVDPVIELDAQTFAMYAMDDWSWKRDFLHSTSRYV